MTSTTAFWGSSGALVVTLFLLLARVVAVGCTPQGRDPHYSRPCGGCPDWWWEDLQVDPTVEQPVPEVSVSRLLGVPQGVAVSLALGVTGHDHLGAPLHPPFGSWTGEHGTPGAVPAVGLTFRIGIPGAFSYVIHSDFPERHDDSQGQRQDRLSEGRLLHLGFGLVARSEVGHYFLVEGLGLALPSFFSSPFLPNGVACLPPNGFLVVAMPSIPSVWSWREVDSTSPLVNQHLLESIRHLLAVFRCVGDAVSF